MRLSQRSNAGGTSSHCTIDALIRASSRLRRVDLPRADARRKRINHSAQLVALTSVHRSMSDELVPDAAVRCQSCGRFVSTWLEFKCRTTAVIMAQHATARAPHFLSCDPLFVAEAGQEL